MHKIIHSVPHNCWLKRLNTQLDKSTNQKLIKVPKERIRKHYQNTLGTSLINSPLSPSFLYVYTVYLHWIFLILSEYWLKDIPSWFLTDKDFKVVCLETFLKCKMIPGTIGQMEIFFFAKKTKGCMVFKGRSTLQLRFVCLSNKQCGTL